MTTPMNGSSGPLRVVAICGSLRPGSFTRKALTIALEGAREQGAETYVLDLADYDLPLCNGSKDAASYGPDVARLRQEIGAATGIILGTPEYHSSYSGVLKNALDLTGFQEFEGKMVGLLAVSGGSMGATNALTALRAVGRSLHAWVVPHEASIPQAWKQFDEDGNLKDEAIAERVRELGRQVMRFACLHNAEQALDFLRAWEDAPFNPGGE